jgi:hypothetical protein
VSALMETLNAEISGTFDLESLTQAAGGLDGLLWMSSHIADADRTEAIAADTRDDHRT